MHAIKAALATLLSVAAVSASAAVVTLSNIQGAWYNADPFSAVVSNTGQGPNPQIRWGTAATELGISGYNFSASGTTNVTLPPSPSADFVLGQFQHLNFPVFGSITGVRLDIAADIAVDGTSIGTRTFTFDFLHEETPNTDPCLYISTTPCADRVRVQFNNLSELFSVGGDIYTLNISGFQVGSGFVTEFITQEGQINTANLMANLTLRSNLQAPEPGTLALVGLSLVGLAALGRRSRS